MARRFGPIAGIEPISNQMPMALPDDLRSLPYLVHTNRELSLMLAGKKPLSYFMSMDGHEPEYMVRYLRMFDRHTAQGTFRKFEQTKPVPRLPHLTFRRIFYTLPGEEWRAAAMLDLLAEPGDWSEARERKFGSLLGYEEWQNEFWIERVRSKRLT